MAILINILKISLFIVCLMVQSLSTDEAIPKDDFKAQAQKHFPNREEPYSLTDLATAFYPILQPNIRQTFNDYFGVLFLPNFPVPVHPNSVITGGYRCLYVDMMLAKGDEAAQLEALYKRMKFHKKSITLFRPDLASQIPEVEGCRNCIMEFSQYDH